MVLAVVRELVLEDMCPAASGRGGRGRMREEAAVADEVPLPLATLWVEESEAVLQ